MPAFSTYERKDMKSIKLIEAWGKHAKGTLLEVDETTYAELIEAKTAVDYDPEAEKKAAEAQAEAERRTVAVIEETVKRVVAEVAPKDEKKSVHIDVKEGIDKDPKSGFKSFGEFAQAVKSNPSDPRLAAANAKAPSGLNVGVDSEGGFLVPEEYVARLLDKTQEVGVAMSRAQRIPMQGEIVKLPAIVESSRASTRSGGVLGYWKSEAAQYTASKPTFGEVKLELSKLTLLTYVTDELSNFSAISLDAILPVLASKELAFKLDDAAINGTGAGQPLGLLASPALVSVDKESGQPAATIQTENIVKMWARLHASSRANAVWFINQDIEPQLQTMYVGLGTAGLATYMPPGGVSGAPYATLMGRPVIACEQCQTLGTVGDIILADMSQYLYGEHVSGTQSATSIHLKFDYGEVAYRWTMFADGRPWWSSALTPFKGTSTQSPFVALATRS